MSAFKDKLEQQGESELDEGTKDLADRVGVGQDENQGKSQDENARNEPQAPTTPGASER